MQPTEQSAPESESDRLSRVIFEYASRIALEQDPDHLLSLNAALGRDIIGADRCSIWLADDRSSTLWTKVADGMPEIRIPMGEGLVGICFASNQPVRVNDVASSPHFLRTIDAGSGYVTTNVLVLPLRTRGGPAIGALQVLNKPGGFSNSDEQLLGLTAAYIASAIETQRLRIVAESAKVMRRELEIASDVQRHLLPQAFPAVPGLEASSFFRPAKVVGGDYYDFFVLPDGSLGFSVGDVAGKGIAAAMLMASLQSWLRTQAHRMSHDLAALMNDFNKSVCASSSPDRYSTIFTGVIDIAAKTLTYVNAGHVRPMAVTASGELTYLEGGGMPIGLMEVASYQESVVSLAEGTTLLFCSDGFTEVMNTADELWDEREAEAALQANVGLPVKQLIDHLVRMADEFAGGAEQSDDMTILILRVL